MRKEWIARGYGWRLGTLIGNGLFRVWLGKLVITLRDPLWRLRPLPLRQGGARFGQA
jgi:hypothetical protein